MAVWKSSLLTLLTAVWQLFCTLSMAIVKWNKTKQTTILNVTGFFNMLSENPGPQFYIFWELEGSCSRDMLKRDSSHREGKDNLSVLDTKQAYIQIFSRMNV